MKFFSDSEFLVGLETKGCTTEREKYFYLESSSFCLFGFANVCFMSGGKSLLKVNYPFCLASGVKTTRCTLWAFSKLSKLDPFQVLWEVVILEM